MKKTLTALVMAASLVMAPATAFAEAETEAASSSLMTLQGLDDMSNIWTVCMDAESMIGSVVLQIPDEEGAYPDENAVVVCGPMVIGEDSLTITDDEDGLDYVFGMKDVEGSDTEVEMTYEPTGSTVVLALVDQSTMSEENANMDFYAGFDENGLQWTVGFDWDNSIIAFNVMSDEGENTVAGTFVDDEAGTLTITQEDGTVFDLAYEPVNGDYKTLILTDDSGTSITVTYVNPEALDLAA